MKTRKCPVCAHKNPYTAHSCDHCKSPLDGGATHEKTVLTDPKEITIEPGDYITEKYRVIREIGQGGMGIVYLVEEVGLNKRCALKLIHPQLVASSEALERFKAEVTVCREMNHPAIIRVFEFGWTDQKHYFFTMEYLQGHALSELLAKRKNNLPPFSVDEIEQIFTPLLKGLAYAHKHTVHRDIKPDNIMVCGEFPDVTIKMLDFGIARTMSPSRFMVTRQGMGTAYYMAPEQAKDAHHLDHRADLYSIGIILYEMLTGQQAMGRFKPLELETGIAYAPLDPVIDTALVPNPEERYDDASRMLTAIKNGLQKIRRNIAENATKTKNDEKENPEPEPQKPDPTPIAAEPAPAPEPETEQPPEEEKQPEKTREKKNPAPIFAGLAVLLLVAGFSIFFLGGGDKPDPTVVEETPPPAQTKQPAVDPRAEQLAGCEQYKIDNAWKQAETCYRAVFEKFPDEEQAKAGLDTIYKQVTVAGSRAVEQGDLNTARKQLALLQSFTGTGDSAQALQKQINDYEKQQEITAQKAKEEKQKREIAGQLARCGELHNNNEFTKAYSCYTDVLQRDSNNQQARTGVEGIIRDVLNTASRAVGKGDLNTARKQLALLESFAGGKDKAKALQQQISDYEKQQAIAAQKEKEKLRKQRQEEQRKAKIAELEQQIKAAEQAENWQEMLTLAQDLFELQPRNSLANDALSFARRKIAEEKEKASLAHLTITPEPANARIRILNIVPPYEPDMQLKPGRYHIEVSAPGYQTILEWVGFEAGEQINLSYKLKKKEKLKEKTSVATPKLGFTPAYGAVRFVSVPPGADVISLKDEQFLGRTPVTITWESKSGNPIFVAVEVKKTGYNEQIVSFDIEPNSENKSDAENKSQVRNIVLTRRANNMVMDKYDRMELNHVYERGISNKPSFWVNPDTGNQYQVTPQAAYTDPKTKRTCRNAKINSIINGKHQTDYATACRNEYGQWQLTQSLTTIGKKSNTAFKKKLVGSQKEQQIAIRAKNACDDGDMWGCVALAGMFDSGSGLHKDEDISLQLLKKACAKNNPLGCFGFVQAGHTTFPPDQINTAKHRAIQAAEQSCNNDEPFGCIILALIYESSEFVTKTKINNSQLFAKIKDLARTSCNNDDMMGCVALGTLYASGMNNFDKDEKKAFKLFKKSCDNGAIIGCIFQLGIH